MGGLSPTSKNWIFLGVKELILSSQPFISTSVPGHPSREDFPDFDMGVSKNRGTPKWMVRMMEKPYFLIKLDDLGYHYFRKHPHWPKVKVALQPHVQCFSTDLLEAIEAERVVERWCLDAPKKTQVGTTHNSTWRSHNHDCGEEQ